MLKITFISFQESNPRATSIGGGTSGGVEEFNRKPSRAEVTKLGDATDEDNDISKVELRNPSKLHLNSATPFKASSPPSNAISSHSSPNSGTQHDQDGNKVMHRLKTTFC